jgi:hypothetical protein
MLFALVLLGLMVAGLLLLLLLLRQSVVAVSVWGLLVAASVHGQSIGFLKITAA